MLRHDITRLPFVLLQALYTALFTHAAVILHTVIVIIATEVTAWFALIRIPWMVVTAVLIKVRRSITQAAGHQSTERNR